MQTFQLQLLNIKLQLLGKSQLKLEFNKSSLPFNNRSFYNYLKLKI